MAKITVYCPKCSARYSIEEANLGKTGKCQKCDTSFVLVRPADPDTRTVEAPPEEAQHLSPSRGGAQGGASEIWNVGDTILDVYEVRVLNPAHEGEKHYAEGGMGLVYRVHHRGWDLDLALKSPKSETFDTEQGKRDFERECKTWVELGLHPNIVTCYYVRRVDGIPRVFAEFVEGGSLDEWIQTKRLYQGGPEQSLRRILDIAVQFAWGLHYAHEQGLIHQDVKPANVMMQGEVPKVTDFGLAKARSVAQRIDPDATQASMLVSWGGMTPAFCSPEQVEAAVQAEGKVPSQERTKLTRRTDIWSWALTVFAMFYGRAPCRYGGQTAGEVFRVWRSRGLSRPAHVRARPADQGSVRDKNVSQNASPSAPLPIGGAKGEGFGIGSTSKERESGDRHLPTMPDALAALVQRCFQHNPDARPQTMREVAQTLVAIYRQVTGKSYPRREPVRTGLMANSLNNRAASLLDLGKFDEATRLLDQAWERHPWQPQVTHNRGLLAWRSGRITDTDLVTELEELCKTRPEDWMAAYSLGLAQLERGEVRLAVGALEQAAALGGGCELRATLEEARSLLPQAPRCVRVFTGQAPYVTTVLLSADNRWALSGASARKLRLWEVVTGRSLMGLDVPGKGFSSSPDGRWELVAEDDRTLRLTGLTSPRRVHVFRRIVWGGSPSAGSESADGRWKVTGGDRYAFEIRETPSGVLAQVFRGHTGPVNSVFVSADGRWALSGSGDKTLRLWEVPTGRCIRTLKGHTHPVSSVFLCPDGRSALSASSGRTLRLWNLELICAPRRRPTAPILLCHVTSSEEAGRAQAEFADLCAAARTAAAAGRYREALELVRTARALPGYQVAKDSLDLWASVGRHCVRREPRDAWCVQTFEGHLDDVCSVFLDAGARWALSGSGDRTLRLWEASTGRPTRTFHGHADWVRSVALSSDARQALSGSWDKTLRLWDVATGDCLRAFQGHANYVTGVFLSADGRRACSASWDRTVKLWDVATGDCLRTFQGHANYVNSVCASRDGRWLLSGSEDHTLRLWEIASGRSLRTFEGHTDWVHSVALARDGRRALSGSKDRTLRLWDVASGGPERVFEGHTGPVTSVVLSSDGRWALSGGKDGTIRLWEVATGRCHHVFEGHTGPVSSVFLSQDARWALSGGEDHSLRLWEIDWDYHFPGWADWDEAARFCLETFLTLHCPYAADRLTRTGQPKWNEDDFRQLITQLECCGFGWLRPEGVRRRLERMTARWQGPPPMPGA